MIWRETLSSDPRHSGKDSTFRNGCRTFELGVLSSFDHDSWILSLRQAYKAATDGGVLKVVHDPKLSRKNKRKVSMIPERNEQGDDYGEYPGPI